MIKTRSQPNSDWPQQTLIFPEATCTNGTALITFRGGPFSPGVAVQPVCVRFPHIHYDPCWVQGGPGMAMIFYRLCCQFHNFVEVDFLTPHVPNESEKNNSILYGNNVRQRMSQVMNVPCTWHGYDDVRLQMEAIKVGKLTIKNSVCSNWFNKNTGIYCFVLFCFIRWFLDVPNCLLFLLYIFLYRF